MPQRDGSKSRRRERRIQAAQSLLANQPADDRGVGQAKLHDDLDLVDSPDLKPRSQTDDASSQLFAPKWRRLLRAIAQRLSARCEDTPSEHGEITGRLLQIFTHGDAIGGGTEEDMTQCLTRFLEVMEMKDSDVGFTLLSAYHLLQAQDLPFCSRTWRPLLVTAVLVAMDMVCAHSKESQLAAMRIQRHVMHWWPQHKAEEGRSVFTSRDMFRTVTRSEITKLYFELRDSGLRVDPGDEGDSTSVAAVFLAEVSGQGSSTGVTLGKQEGSRAQLRPRQRIGRAPAASPQGDDSLNLSDTLSMSFSEDAMPAKSGSVAAVSKRATNIVSL